MSFLEVSAAYSRHFTFGPSVSPPTMASADFWQPHPHPLDRGSTRQPGTSPPVLRTHLLAYARRIYTVPFRTGFGLCRYLPSHPSTAPLSASCSSRQRFAY